MRLRATGEYHKPFVSVRALGLGGGYTTTQGGTEAFFYNPAAFGLIQHAKFNPLYFQLEFGKDDYDLLWTDFEELDDSTRIIKFVEKYLGKNIHYGHRLLMDYYRPNWGLALLIDSLQINASISRVSLLPSAQAEVRLYNGIWFGNGFKIVVYKGDLAIGYNIKYIFKGQSNIRVDGNDIFNIEEFTDDLEARKKEILKVGSGAGFDLGILYNKKMPIGYSASFGAFGENIVPLKYKTSSLIEDVADFSAPDADSFRLAVGMMIESPQKFYTRLRFYIDLRNVFAPGNPFKKLHFGSEFLLEEPFFHYQPIMLRLGCNQGNLTYGLGLDFWTIQINFARYGEEINPRGSITGYEGDTDTRYVFDIRFGW